MCDPKFYHIQTVLSWRFLVYFGGKPNVSIGGA